MPASRAGDARLFALVPCAGRGARAGGDIPKQYVAVDGRPLVSYTLQALLSVTQIEGVTVAVAEGDAAIGDAIAGVASDRVDIVACGGRTRAATVAAGLAALVAAGARSSDWVLVHDAARALVRPEWIERLVDACIGDAVGGLLAVPVADTLKREVGGRSVATLPREEVWQAQTPQMFRVGVLGQALERHGAEATDEASAIEALGLEPLLVRGSAENLKVTHAADFAIAEAILRQRRGAGAAVAVRAGPALAGASS